MLQQFKAGIVFGMLCMLSILYNGAAFQSTTVLKAGKIGSFGPQLFLANGRRDLLKSYSSPNPSENQSFEEVMVRLTKPLGITIEEASDESGNVYIAEVGENASAAGVQEGDVIVGMSPVYGDDLWTVKGQGAEKVFSMVRTRDEDYIKLRLERGHQYHRIFEEGNEELASDNGAGETDLDFKWLWKKIYTEEYLEADE